MKIDLKKVTTNVGVVFGFLALFGISGGFVTGNIQQIWKAPKEIETLKALIHKQDSTIAVLVEANDHMEHFKESIFSFAVSITDNVDKEDWKIGTHGTEYPADVRNTTENYEMAFIRYMWMIYELRYDPDSIRYIMLHDKNEHGSNRSDLYIGD